MIETIYRLNGKDFEAEEYESKIDRKITFIGISGGYSSCLYKIEPNEEKYLYYDCWCEFNDFNLLKPEEQIEKEENQ